MDRAPFGHFEIDRVAIATGVAVSAVEPLADREGLASGVGEMIHKRIVMFDAQSAPGRVVGV